MASCLDVGCVFFMIINFFLIIGAYNFIHMFTIHNISLIYIHTYYNYHVNRMFPYKTIYIFP